MKEAVTDFWNFEGKLTDEERKQVDQSVSHKRSVYFFKKPEHQMKPFLLVVDRLHVKNEDERTHTYQSIWHINSKNPVISDGKVTMDDVTVFVAGKETELRIAEGEKQPEVQGWMAVKGFSAGEIPVPTILGEASGRDCRMVTVLYPHQEEACPIVGVKAEETVDAKEITLVLADGTEWKLTEGEIL